MVRWRQLQQQLLQGWMQLGWQAQQLPHAVQALQEMREVLLPARHCVIRLCPNIA